MGSDNRKGERASKERKHVPEGKDGAQLVTLDSPDTFDPCSVKKCVKYWGHWN